jgi:hypothetical protein
MVPIIMLVPNVPEVKTTEAGLILLLSAKSRINVDCIQTILTNDTMAVKIHAT